MDVQSNKGIFSRQLGSAHIPSNGLIYLNITPISPPGNYSIFFSTFVLLPGGTIKFRLTNFFEYTIEECEPGTILKIGQRSNSSVCVPCLEGTFQPDVGGNECIPCPVGSFSPLPNATQCEPCVPPQYQNEEGQTHCFHCGDGKYGVFYK